MASTPDANNAVNATKKEANPETASNPAGSPHDSSNAGAAENQNPPSNPQPVELKEGNSPLISKEPIPERQVYKIPSYASWFSWNKIHHTERRFLSEFFDGKSPSKTPDLYKEYRDFIINKFLENPQAKITFTQVRRMLVGDVNSIRRVFDFLENWGLVNYQVGSKHHLKSANAAAASPIPPAKPAVACGTVADRAGLASRREASANRQPGRARVFCKHCRVECTHSRYDCLKAGFVLCPKCFADGNYGLGLSASDFKRVVLNALASQKGNDKWTDQDTLLLLEAILLYNDDWKRVAQHVGTKSEAECVTRFIQLPFGEQFKGNVGTVGSDLRLSDIKGENMVSKPLSSPKSSSIQDHEKDAGYDDKHTTEDDVSGPPLKRSHLTPLADASNPIMAQVAFLSGMVGSHPAEAAAHAAVAALCEEDPYATQIANSQETKFTNQKNGCTASGLEGVRRDSEEEASKKEFNEGTDQTTKDGEFYRSATNTVSLTPETRAVAGTDLGAAGIRAKHLADQEDRDIEHLFSTIMETEMKMLQDKIQHFEELDFIVEKERSQVEQIKELLVADRIHFLQQTMNSEVSGSQGKGVG